MQWAFQTEEINIATYGHKTSNAQEGINGTFKYARIQVSQIESVMPIPVPVPTPVPACPCAHRPRFGSTTWLRSGWGSKWKSAFPASVRNWLPPMFTTLLGGHVSCGLGSWR
jgi:hypothetical protein